jgi:hypothetical protein
MFRFVLAAAAAAVLCPLAAAQAQPFPCPDLLRPGIDLADAGSQWLRTAQLLGAAPVQSLTIRRPSSERKIPLCMNPAPADTAGDAGAASQGGGLDVLPLRLRSLYNSAYPLNVNTGPVWAGVGVSSTIEGGAEFRAGPLTLALYPLVAYQQNSDFETRTVNRRGASPYEYPGHPNIDWPQRPGSEPFWTIDPGQSALRLDVRGFAVGVATENMWIGPAQRTPIMLSNNAGGFPHIFFSTARPLGTPVGDFEAQLFWGRMRESDYFDNVPENDHTLIAGATLIYAPSFLPGLFVGGHRSFLANWNTPDWTAPFDHLLNPYVDIRGNPAGDNQLLSMFGRWVLPSAQFEVYGEWAREDHWGAWIDLLREPDHSQGFLLGLQKVTQARGAHLRWWAELVNLQHAVPVRGGRGTQTFYVHSELTQGYTHRGQLLGAWIGPGSNSQALGAERMSADRLTGIFIERVRHDADAYYNQWARFYGESGHDVSMGVWLRHVERVGEAFRLSANASLTRRQNRMFNRYTGEQPPDLHWETNGHLDVELRWSPGSARRR